MTKPSCLKSESLAASWFLRELSGSVSEIRWLGFTRYIYLRLKASLDLLAVQKLDSGRPDHLVAVYHLQVRRPVNAQLR